MTPGDTVVFLGPSLSRAEARRLLPARYLSPVRCGDVLRVRCQRPRTIAIIDGLFESTGAVWHKEILLAMEDGIRVFGASSMGALRAAELAPFGMVGVGPIFEAYRDGIFTDDDEVALLHGPADIGYPARSDAMVNIRATVARAVADRVVGADAGDRLIACAKREFYQERSLATAIDRALGADTADARRFRAFLDRGGYVDQKAEDARALLRHLAARHSTRLASPPRPEAVHRSPFVLRLQHEVLREPFAVRDHDLPVDEQAVHGLGALGPAAHWLPRLAQFLAIAYALGRAEGAATPRDRARVYQRQAFGLGPSARTTRWRNAHDLDVAACDRLVERLGVVTRVVDDELRRAAATRRHQAFLRAWLRLENQYGRRRRGADPIASRIATLWSVIDRVMVQRRLAPQDSLQALSDKFRLARGLDSRAATLAWQRANDLDRTGYLGLVEASSRLSLILDGSLHHLLGLEHTIEPAAWLADAARLVGLYPRLRRLRSKTVADVSRKGTTRRPGE